MNLSLVMKKKLILIYNEGVAGTRSYLRGVIEDIRNYQAFFKSIEGGAWNDAEIKLFHKPSKEDLESYIEENADSEYFLIVFCGHGGSYDGETILELDSLIDLPLGELRGWVKYSRHLIICDCCREAPEAEPIMESLNERIRMFSQGGTIGDRLKARNEYQKAIRATREGAYTVGFAASLGESAGETSKGGFYSHSLLKAASAVAKGRDAGVVSFLQCHYMAEPNVIKLSNDEQHPDYMALRVKEQLPFVVKI